MGGIIRKIWKERGGSMAIIKCKMCGGDLAMVPGQSVAECEYCGTVQTVPSADNVRAIALR